MEIDNVIATCGFSLRQEPRRVVLVENLTGEERELTAPEANLWADVYRRMSRKSADQSSTLTNTCYALIGGATPCVGTFSQ